MTGEEKKIEERIMPWRLGFVMAFSLFLVVTFVYYLPLRFQHQAVEHMAGEMPMGAMMEEHADEAHVAIYHEETEVREGLVVNFNLTPVPVLAGTSTRLDFFVNEKPGNVPVPASALEIEHTKLMHVIGVRDDLNEFFHIHPQPFVPAESITPEEITVGPGTGPSGPDLSPEERERLLAGTQIEAPRGPEFGILSTMHIFLTPGRYKVWSEIKKDGVNHAFGHPEFTVQGFGSRYEKQVSFGRNAVVGLYQVSLELDEPVAKGHPHELAFDIHTVTGDEVEVEPYLAADMHLTIIKDDWKQFIHTHPTALGGEEHHGSLISEARANGTDIPGAVHDEAGEDEVVRFAVTFPESGLYKAFAQFRPRGVNLPPDEALTVSFWIRVEDKVPAAIPDSVLYTAVSLALIVLLSWGVRRYLQGAR